MGAMTVAHAQLVRRGPTREVQGQGYVNHAQEEPTITRKRRWNVEHAQWGPTITRKGRRSALYVLLENTLPRSVPKLNTPVGRAIFHFTTALGGPLHVTDALPTQTLAQMVVPQFTDLAHMVIPQYPTVFALSGIRAMTVAHVQNVCRGPTRKVGGLRSAIAAQLENTLRITVPERPNSVLAAQSIHTAPLWGHPVPTHVSDALPTHLLPMVMAK
jgi:hypothetical protein